MNPRQEGPGTFASFILMATVEVGGFWFEYLDAIGDLQ